MSTRNARVSDVPPPESHPTLAATEKRRVCTSGRNLPPTILRGAACNLGGLLNSPLPGFIRSPPGDACARTTNRPPSLRSGRPQGIVPGTGKYRHRRIWDLIDGEAVKWERGIIPGILHQYPHRDSNTGLWLRRPTLYPLSYGGYFNASQFCHTVASLSNAPPIWCTCRRPASPCLAPPVRPGQPVSHSCFSNCISSQTGMPANP